LGLADTNREHRHGGIGLLTPHDVYHDLAQSRRDDRAAVLTAAWHARPDRFPNGCPVPPELPTAAWISKPLAASVGRVTQADGIAGESEVMASDQKEITRCQYRKLRPRLSQTR
jgi:hypothetical protein